jgi:hypothetical protein
MHAVVLAPLPTATPDEFTSHARVSVNPGTFITPTSSTRKLSLPIPCFPPASVTTTSRKLGVASSSMVMFATSCDELTNLVLLVRTLGSSTPASLNFTFAPAPNPEPLIFTSIVTPLGESLGSAEVTASPVGAFALAADASIRIGAAGTLASEHAPRNARTRGER